MDRRSGEAVGPGRAEDYHRRSRSPLLRLQRQQQHQRRKCRGRCAGAGGRGSPLSEAMSIQARTAELTGVQRFQLSERQIPDPGRGEVQVRVAAVGVCGSDLHSYTEGAVGDSPCQYPMVLGHEPSGTVVKTGAGVTGWSPGGRAALEPAIYCYHCEFCRSGRHNICANIRFLSTPGNPGFFREFVNLPVPSLLAIPKEVSLELATIVEPLAIAMHSMEFAAIRLGETVVVFGAGAIGLLTI